MPTPLVRSWGPFSVSLTKNPPKKGMLGRQKSKQLQTTNILRSPYLQTSNSFLISLPSRCLLFLDVEFWAGYWAGTQKHPSSPAMATPTLEILEGNIGLLISRETLGDTPEQVCRGSQALEWTTMCELGWRHPHPHQSCLHGITPRVTSSRVAFQYMVFITSIMKLMKINVPFK